MIPGTTFKSLVKRPIPGIVSGLVVAVVNFSHAYAISLIQAAYMLSVKRTSLVFGVIFGVVLFKEQQLRERLFGAFVMMLGVFIIAILG
ncbi:MAG: hypothetical protein JW932_15590 [Deltaproteobacteria bacterium]|nr:hypothetical protein [Deltaproteobacteria bacterium]